MKIYSGFESLAQENYEPKRIVSLVPSLTEFLLELGFEKRLVGRTLYCERPVDLVESIAVVGGTKKISVKKVLELKPDLVLAQKEENDRAQVEEIAQTVPCVVSEIDTVDSFVSYVSDFASLFYEPLVQDFYLEIMNLRDQCKKSDRKYSRCLYFIWKEPWMVAGKGTYIDSVMNLAGFENALSDSRYPVLNWEEIQELSPDLVLLSSEPYSFNESHLNWFQRNLESARIELVDGRFYSWYGYASLQCLRSLNAGSVFARVLS